jgi:hypothetical protein
MICKYYELEKDNKINKEITIGIIGIGIIIGIIIIDIIEIIIIIDNKRYKVMVIL